MLSQRAGCDCGRGAMLAPDILGMNVHSPVFAPSASSTQLACIFGPIAVRVTAKELLCFDLSEVLSQLCDGAGQLLTANERFPFSTCSPFPRHAYLKDQTLLGGLSRRGYERDCVDCMADVGLSLSP